MNKRNVALLILLLMASSTLAALKPRWTPPKPENTIVDSNVYEFNVNVKFIEGSKVRMQDGKLTSLTGYDLKVFADIVSNTKITNLHRLFSRPEHILDAERKRGQQRSGKELGDLNNYYRIVLDSSESTGQFIDNLNHIAVIEIAYPVYKVIPTEDIPPETPDFSELQGYLFAAPGGIDAPAAWEHRGGKGAGIKIIDIDSGTYYPHEDLVEPFYAEPEGQDLRSHAVSSVGIVNAQHNGYGMSGICPEAEIGVLSFIYVERQPVYNFADAVNRMTQVLDEGDIFFVVVSVQVPFENNEVAVVPFEIGQGVFDVVETATANGLICLESAGNGRSNLDNWEPFNPDNRHSGAIFVGAGCPPSGNFGPDRSRCDFSNYGRRVELQGWGREVTTTGGGNLFHPGGDNAQAYTTEFSGTSSATPIVAGAVACIQGIYKYRTNGRVLTGEQIRDILIETGTPQNVEGRQGPIGPRPNLHEAIENIPFPFGAIRGNVTDAANHESVVGAMILTCHRDTTYTNETGDYSIEEAITFFDTEILFSAYGYNDSLVNDLDFNEGDDIELNIQLLHPRFQISEELFEVELECDDSIDLQFEIQNDGNGPLEWNVRKRNPINPDADPHSLQQSYNFTELLGDNRLEGIAFIEDRFYITGRGNDEPYLYILNRDRELIEQHPQVGNSRYGMRGLAYDDELLWGVESEMVYSFTTDGDSVSGWATNYSPNLAITYDQERELLWIAGPTSDYISGYNRQGEEILQLDRMELRIFGLGFWSDDVDDYNLYILSSPDNRTQYLHKMNIETGDTLFQQEINPDGNYRPCSAFITDDPNSFDWCIFTVNDVEGSESVQVWRLSLKTDWFNLQPDQGQIESGQTENFVLNINAEGLLPGFYPGELLITHNAEGDSASLLILLNTDPNEAKEIPLDPPRKFGIESAYPNPFNGTTTIQYRLSETTVVSLKVFDLAGRMVTELISGDVQAGFHSAVWQSGNAATGLYLVRMESAGFSSVRKVTLLR